MKQNKVICDFNSKSYLVEIDDICKLLLIKYSDMFDGKSAFKMANTLYNNGIRTYMFFEEKYGIDEIVFYLKAKEKIIKLKDKVKKNNIYSDKKDNINGDVEIIDMSVYLNKKKNNRR